MTHLNDLATQCARTSDPQRIKELIYDFAMDVIGQNQNVSDAESEEVLNCYVHLNLCLSMMRAKLDLMNEAEMMLLMTKAEARPPRSMGLC